MGRGAAMRETNKNGRQLAGVRHGKPIKRREPPIMAEDNQTGADGQQEPEQHATTPKDVNDAKPRTFTQEEVDRIVNERLGRERGRKSDYEELKEKAGQTSDLESRLSKALEENERLRSEAKQAEHEKELSAIRANVAARHGITDPGVLAGDDEKQIGEHAEKLMKVFADMRSRGTVAEQSARTGQAKAKRSSRDDFADAMRNTLL